MHTAGACEVASPSWLAEWPGVAVDVDADVVVNVVFAEASVLKSAQAKF